MDDQSLSVARTGLAQKKTTIAVLLSFTVGAVLSVVVGHGSDALVAGLVSPFVAVAAMAVPGEVSLRGGLLSGTIGIAGLMLAEAGVGHPAAAGLAMAAVAVISAVSVAGGKRTAALGKVLGTAYFLPAVAGMVDGLRAGDVFELGLIGVAGGLVSVALLILLRRLLEGDLPAGLADEVRRDRQGGSLPAMVEELRRLGPDARSGIRRAVLLGAAMAVFQIDGDTNAFWVLLTVFLVLETDAALARGKARARAYGAVAGSLAVGLLAQFVTGDVLVAAGVVALLAGLSVYRTNYAAYTAGISFLMVALYGAQDGSVLTWAGLRILDTLIAVTLVIAAVRLLPDAPRSTPE